MVDLTQLNKFFIDDFVKDIFIGTLQQLFMQNPGEFHYDPDDQLTRLSITDQFSTDNLTPEFKPTIYIRRRPLGFMNTSIDSLVTGNLATGARGYADLVSGIVELVAVSRVGLEACRLGGLVFVLINEFKQEIRSLGMHDVSVKSLGEEEIKDVRSIFRIVEVPVTIQYAFAYSWMKTVMEASDAKPFNGISFGTSSSSGSSSRPFNDIGFGRSTDPVTGELLNIAAPPDCGSPCSKSGGTTCTPLSEPTPKES
jgi:hypothetical protein